RVGGTTGRPSVQPRAKQISICSAALIGMQISPSASGISDAVSSLIAIHPYSRSNSDCFLTLIGLTVLKERQHAPAQFLGTSVDLARRQAGERMRHHHEPEFGNAP